MKFEVKNRIISRIDVDSDHTKPPIGDNSDYCAEFTFDSEWDGHIKTARFIKDGNYAEKILQNDKCLIPVEVLKHGNLKVGVFSADMTSTQCEVYVKPSIKESLGSPAEPTPDVYAQIIKMIEDIGQPVISEAQIEKAVNDYLAEHPIDAVTDAEMQSYVSQFFSAHKDELKGDKGDKGDKGEQGIQGVPGTDGSNGADGADGYTPVRGVDYWTNADIQQIQGYIDGQIGGALNGTY